MFKGREIRCFRFWRDSFARVIAEFAAGLCDRHNTFFYAQNFFVIQFCSVDAITAGTGHFLPEKHIKPSLSFMRRCYYTSNFAELLPLFSEFSEI